MSASGTGPPRGEVDRVGPTNSDQGEVNNIENIGRKPRQNGAELTQDETFELLKNSRRRMVIRYLMDNEGSATLSEVAEHIAAAENGITVEDLSSDERKRVYIGLYQCHLPKMDDFGIVEYEKNRGTIDLQDSVSQLEPYMGPLTEPEDNSAQLAVGTAIAVSGLVLIGAAGVGPLETIPSITWVLVSVAGILGVALIQVIDPPDVLPKPRSMFE